MSNPPWLAADCKGTKVKTEPAGRRNAKQTQKKPKPGFVHPAAFTAFEAALQEEFGPKSKRRKKQVGEDDGAKEAYFEWSAEYNLQTTEEIRQQTDARTATRIEAFAREFIRLPNMSKAYQTCSIDLGELTPNSIKKAASILYWHPYCQRYLADLRAKLDKEAVCSAADIEARLWEEANSQDEDATAATRVNSLKFLGKCKGIDQPKGDDTKGHSSGVMIMPGITPEQWAALAPMSQDKLKKDCKEQ